MRIQNTSGVKADLLVDSIGSYYTDPANIGTTFKSISPTRIADTRSSTSGIRQGKLVAASQASITVPAALDTYATVAYEGTITVANATATTYHTQWKASRTRPGTSDLNTTKGRNRSNGFTTKTAAVASGGSDWGFKVYNCSGSVDVLEDVTGRFEVTPDLIAVSVAQRAPSRTGAAPRVASDE